MEKYLKTIHSNSRKGKCEPCITSKLPLVASRSLTLANTKVIKHSNYTPILTNSTVKANLSFT